MTAHDIVFLMSNVYILLTIYTCYSNDGWVLDVVLPLRHALLPFYLYLSIYWYINQQHACLYRPHAWRYLLCMSILSHWVDASMCSFIIDDHDVRKMNDVYVHLFVIVRVISSLLHTHIYLINPINPCTVNCTYPRCCARHTASSRDCIHTYTLTHSLLQTFVCCVGREDEWEVMMCYLWWRVVSLKCCLMRWGLYWSTLAHILFFYLF